MKKISQKDRKYVISSIVPPIVVFAVITLVPTIMLIILTLTNLSLTTAGKQDFIGLGNYIRLFKDTRFLISLEVTLKFVIGAVFLELLIGTGLALFLQKCVRFIRTIILLPSMLAPVVIGLLWKIVLNFEGPLNSIINILHIPKIAWLTNPNFIFFVVMFVDIWQWSPFMMLIIFAGLQRVDKNIVEAAQVDGASRLQTFGYITLPSIESILLVAIAIRLIDAIKTFDTIFVLTGGGPGHSTELLSIYAFKTGISGGNIAYASAIAIFILLIAFTASRFLLARRVLGK